jgi:hypothetical protein
MVLLIGALACYCNLPRLHIVSAMGETVNAVRVLDPISHIRLAARAALDDDQAQTAREDLNDGRDSLKLIAFTPALIAAIAATTSWIPPTLAPDDSTPGFDCLPAPLTGLPGVLLRLDLPPPRTRCDCPALKATASARVAALRARAPPLR